MNLRNFLAKLEKEGKLVRIKREVSVKNEIADIIYSLNEQPVIFDNINGYDFSIFAGITSNRDIIAEGLGITKDKLLFKLVSETRLNLLSERFCRDLIFHLDQKFSLFSS